MITARLARPDELATAIDITNRAYAPWVPILGGKPTPMTEDYDPLIAAGRVWIVEVDGAVSGLIVVEPEDDALLVFSLALLPEAQGRGVGRWMLSHVDRLAQEGGFRAVRLYTNTRMTRNIALYRHCGFREAGEQPNPKRPDWQVLYMEKDLTPRA